MGTLSDVLTAFAASASDPIVLMLAGGGFVIGVLSVIFGGGMFFSVPLMRVLFPGITFGAIVGNVKVGSLFRSIGSTFSTRHEIEYRRNIEVIVIAFAGTILGAFLISHLDQRWLLPAAFLAILVVEFAPRLSRLITARTFRVASFITGLYAGTFSAGLGIVLVALLRLKHPEDTSIAFVKVQARFVEFILAVAAVMTHWVAGNLIAAIWVPWAIGSIIGGVVGGMILRHMMQWSGAVQKGILRASYLVNVLTSWGSV